MPDGIGQPTSKQGEWSEAVCSPRNLPKPGLGKEAVELTATVKLSARAVWWSPPQAEAAEDRRDRPPGGVKPRAAHRIDQVNEPAAIVAGHDRVSARLEHPRHLV